MNCCYKNLSAITLSIFILLISDNLQAQETPVSDSIIYTMAFDALFGTDQNLINGRKYTPAYPLAPGHPYLDEKDFFNGTVTINGILYSEVKLKYNIHEQRIILEYITQTGGIKHLVLNSHLIDQFTLSDKLFKKVEINGQQPSFYQVIVVDDLSLFYLWKKKLVLNSGSASSYYKYSDQNRTSYLFDGENFHEFRNSKTFYSIIPSEIAKEMKMYIRKNRIDIKTAEDIRMIQLLEKWQQLL
jgi:hypothetical protein